MTNFLRIIYLAFNLYFSRKGTESPASLVEIVREFRKEKKKILQQKFKHKQRFKRQRLDPRFKNTKPKDHRFSNQKSLRRMYRNS